MTSFRPMISRRLIAAALPALTLLPILAGCGSTTATTSTTAQAATNPGAAAYAYARCMREHGVSGFPDPQVKTSANGTSVSQMLPASAAASPAFKTAQKACQGILPAATGTIPGQQQAHKKVLLAFAHCLRSHGLAGFPDPNRDGQITQQMISAAGFDLHSSQFQRAATACVGVTHGAITAAQVQAAASHQP
jgi:hypothetical protein